ncbi:MAG: hypothetical protein GX946_00045 [Oligosphaeraceae bacterium]|nr:hypothetical protein [Oligosphaeraceae bacterium]
MLAISCRKADNEAQRHHFESRYVIAMAKAADRRDLQAVTGFICCRLLRGRTAGR